MIFSGKRLEEKMFAAVLKHKAFGRDQPQNSELKHPKLIFCHYVN